MAPQPAASAATPQVGMPKSKDDKPKLRFTTLGCLEEEECVPAPRWGGGTSSCRRSKVHNKDMVCLKSSALHRLHQVGLMPLRSEMISPRQAAPAHAALGSTTHQALHLIAHAIFTVFQLRPAMAVLSDELDSVRVHARSGN